MDCNTPGLPVQHQLPEFTQTHVHWVGDTIQSSHPLSSPYTPAFNLSQHQGLFKWVSSSHQVAKVYWSFSFSNSPFNGLNLNRDTNSIVSANLFRKKVMFQSIMYSQMLNTVLFKELAIIIGIFQLLLVTENLDYNHFYCKLIFPMEKLI